MDSYKLELMNFKFGEKFLRYVLNYEEPFKSEIEENSFSFNQLEVLEDLERLVLSSEYLISQKKYITLKEYLFQYGEFFNECRRKCGGEILNISSNDEFLNYLYSKAILFYPCFLIVNNQLFYKYEATIKIPSSIEEGKIIETLALNHHSLKNLFFVENVEGIGSCNFRF